MHCLMYFKNKACLIITMTEHQTFSKPTLKFFNSAVIYFYTFREKSVGGGRQAGVKNRGTDKARKSEVGGQKTGVGGRKSAEWKIIEWAVSTNRQSAFYLQPFSINATAFSNIRIPGVGPLPKGLLSRRACSFFRVQLGWLVQWL